MWYIFLLSFVRYCRTLIIPSNYHEHRNEPSFLFLSNTFIKFIREKISFPNNVVSLTEAIFSLIFHFVIGTFCYFVHTKMPCISEMFLFYDHFESTLHVFSTFTRTRVPGISIYPEIFQQIPAKAYFKQTEVVSFSIVPFDANNLCRISLYLSQIK